MRTMRLYRVFGERHEETVLPAMEVVAKDIYEALDMMKHIKFPRVTAIREDGEVVVP